MSCAFSVAETVGVAPEANGKVATPISAAIAIVEMYLIFMAIPA